MKKIVFLALTLIVLNNSNSYAQSYTTAGGLQIDFGDGSTFVGPAIKHFFSEGNAIEGEVLFGSGVTYLQAFYQYQKDFPNASNLQWYIGGGPSLGLGGGSSAFYLRPMAGLDYKVNDVPLALSFDWRPSFYLGNAYGASRFTGARFGLGIKYVIK